LFDLHKDRLDRRWLQAIFDANYLQDQLDAQAKGTTGYAAVRPKILLACEIPLPSLAEQWRVVMRIEELATQIREAYTLRKQAAEEAEALLTATLDRIFPETGKSQFQYQLVSDAIESHKQGYYSGGKPIEGAVKFARITDITDEGYLNYLSMPGISIEDSALESFLVCPNDFLFARTGGAGRFGLATEGLDCVFASYLIRFRFKSEYLPRFLHFYFRGRRFQNQIRSRIHGGVNQNVHAEDIKDATVPKISLAEQRRIVTELEAVQAEVDALKRLQTETATELDALLPAILDRAFKGEL
jgi:type I restriction enzyme S subunit